MLAPTQIRRPTCTDSRRPSPHVHLHIHEGMLKQCKTAHTPGCTCMHTPPHAIKCTLTYTSMDTFTDMPRPSPIIHPHPRTIPHAVHPPVPCPSPGSSSPMPCPLCRASTSHRQSWPASSPVCPLLTSLCPCPGHMSKQDGCMYTTHACSTCMLCIHITCHVPAFVHTSCVPLLTIMVCWDTKPAQRQD